MNKPQLSFEEYKSLLLDYDFRYFLYKDFQDNNYHQQKIDDIYTKYQSVTDDLNQNIKKNKKQELLYLEGQVKLMFYGGLLPSLFKFDGWTRSSSTLDFSGMGENWAYFNIWQKHLRRKRIIKQLWSYTVKSGVLLAYILTIFKIIEYFTVS